MALIKCPECSQSVSSIAPTCPHCGAPVASYSDVATSGVPITTIQQSSKQLKRWSAFGGLIFVVGLSTVILGFLGQHMFVVLSGVALVAVSFAWVITVSIITWWHHG